MTTFARTFRCVSLVSSDGIASCVRMDLCQKVPVRIEQFGNLGPKAVDRDLENLDPCQDGQRKAIRPCRNLSPWNSSEAFAGISNPPKLETRERSSGVRNFSPHPGDEVQLTNGWSATNWSGSHVSPVATCTGNGASPCTTMHRKVAYYAGVPSLPRHPRKARRIPSSPETR